VTVDATGAFEPAKRGRNDRYGEAVDEQQRQVGAQPRQRQQDDYGSRRNRKAQFNFGVRALSFFEKGRNPPLKNALGPISFPVSIMGASDAEKANQCDGHSDENG
jgi:hypothetical protein